MFAGIYFAGAMFAGMPLTAAELRAILATVTLCPVMAASDITTAPFALASLSLSGQILGTPSLSQKIDASAHRLEPYVDASSELAPEES